MEELMENGERGRTVIVCVESTADPSPNGRPLAW